MQQIIQKKTYDLISRTPSEELMNFWQNNKENERISFENMSLFDLPKFKKIIIDPSIFTEEKYLKSLFYIMEKAEVYISNSLIDLIKNNEIFILFKYFSWRLPKTIELPENAYSIIDDLKPYKPERILFNEKLYGGILKLNLPEIVSNIILEQYTFLEEYSALLSRYRKTKSYLQRAGLSVINIPKKLLNIKREFYNHHHGITWIFHILLNAARVYQLDEISPLINMIFDITDYVLVVFDP